MQLSCKKGIGFVCVPKCGSTSVEALMRRQCDFSMSGNPTLKHIRYCQIEESVFPLLQSLRISRPFMFAIVREPVSWMKSWYQFRARDELAPLGHPQHRNYTGHMTFPEFIENFLAPRPPSFARVQSQSHYLFAKDGSIGVNKIIALEDIDTEVPKLLAQFDISVPGGISRKNTSPHKQTELLPPDLLKRLQTHLAMDFKLYNSTQ